jgi:hypothetical protein
MGEAEKRMMAYEEGRRKKSRVEMRFKDKNIDL